MRWEAVPPDGEATVTWQSECIPAPTISVAGVCRDDGGAIAVAVEDAVATRYNVFAGPFEPETVRSTANETAVFEFGPVSDGSQRVVVEPLEDLRIELIITSVDVECGLPPPTDPPPVTTEPTSATATTVPAVAQLSVTSTTAAGVAATLPQTGGSASEGRTSGVAAVLVLGGALLLVAARRRTV